MSANHFPSVKPSKIKISFSHCKDMSAARNHSFPCDDHQSCHLSSGLRVIRASCFECMRVSLCVSWLMSSFMSLWMLPCGIQWMCLRRALQCSVKGITNVCLCAGSDSLVISGKSECVAVFQYNLITYNMETMQIQMFPRSNFWRLSGSWQRGITWERERGKWTKENWASQACV